MMTALVILLSLSLVPAFIRLVLGPTLPDRVVALDLMSTVGVGMTALLAIIYGRLVFLDIAIVLALISFVGTVAFAHYLERRYRKERR